LRRYARSRDSPPDVGVIFAAFCELEDSEIAGHKPSLVFVSDKNEIKSIKTKH
jgi:aspartate 1-decarboxylase